MVGINNSEIIFNENDFNLFCKKNKIIFPESFVNYLKKFNDSELEPNIIHFPDNDYYIRYFYGITHEDYSDIRLIYESYYDRLPKKCIPIADPDFGNQVCISLEEESYGKIYFWDHETMDTEYGQECCFSLSDMILLADSFEELLEKIVESPY